MFPTELGVRESFYHATRELVLDFDRECELDKNLTRAVGESSHCIFAFKQVPPSSVAQIIYHRHSLTMSESEPFIRPSAGPIIETGDGEKRACYHFIQFDAHDDAYHCAYAIKNCGGAIFVVMHNTIADMSLSPATKIPTPAIITATKTEGAANDIVKRVFDVEEEFFRVGSKVLAYGLPQFRFGMTYKVQIMCLSHTNACADVCTKEGVKICSVPLHNLACFDRPRPFTLTTPDGGLYTVCIDRQSFKLAGYMHIGNILAMVQHQIDKSYASPRWSEEEEYERHSQVCL